MACVFIIFELDVHARALALARLLGHCALSEVTGSQHPYGLGWPPPPKHPYRLLQPPGEAMCQCTHGPIVIEITDLT